MKVFIGESSYIIRKGIIHLFNQCSDSGAIQEFMSSEDLEGALQQSTPDIIIINTSFNQDDINNLIEEIEVKPIQLYLFNSSLPHNSEKTHLSVFEDKATLVEKIQSAIDEISKGNEVAVGEELSPREKLVLKHVALGQTNKEIADNLYISTHTVISHRKNITRKLNIKTVSGLTVYAILNNLIGMNDVK